MQVRKKALVNSKTIAKLENVQGAVGTGVYDAMARSVGMTNIVKSLGDHSALSDYDTLDRVHAIKRQAVAEGNAEL